MHGYDDELDTKRTWYGLYEGVGSAGFFGRCLGECGKLYVLEEAEVGADGLVIGWGCQSDITVYKSWQRMGPRRTCLGQVKQLPQQELLAAAWRVGGFDAVQAIVAAQAPDGEQAQPVSAPSGD